MDFDADGIDDVIAGSIYEDIYLFRGLGTGRFATRTLLKDKTGKPIKGGYCCTTELFDMDADGDLDLVCAGRISKVRWFRNVGTRSIPRFDPNARSLPMETGAGSVAGSNASYTDWDGDGIRDLVVGSESGYVNWHRNVGQDNQPVFSSAQQLLADPGFQKIKEGDTPTVHGSRAKITVVDYDGDGLRDILLGDFTSCTYSPRPPLSEAELKTRQALEAKVKQIGNKAYYAEINRLNREYHAARKAKDTQAVAQIQALQKELRQPLDELYQKLRPFRTTGYKSHGWVWFYRQVPGNESDLARDVLSVQPVTRRGKVTLRTAGSHTSISPGQQFQVAVNFQIAEGWHIYGPEKGDSYLPTRIEWKLPAGTVVKDVQWPDPLLVKSGDSLQPTYKGSVTALVTFVASSKASPGSRLKLAADVHWQVCTEFLCKPGRAGIKFSIAVGPSTVRNPTSVPGG